MQDGWTAIVVEGDDQKAHYSFDDFAKGNLRTIGGGKCCRKLKGNISNAETKAFEKLARHRNKVIHFYHPTIESDKVQIAQEQSRCWFILKRFLDSMYRYRIEAIDGQMDLYRPYLQAIYDERKQAIIAMRADGVPFETCPACAFEAFQCEWSAENEAEHECLVCGLKPGNEAVGHCADCDSLDSMVQVGCVFYCMNCHQFYSRMDECGHCGALNTHFPQDADGGGDVSAWLGCVGCSGPEG